MNVNERVGHGLTHSNDKTGFFLCQHDCVTHPSKIFMQSQYDISIFQCQVQTKIKADS